MDRHFKFCRHCKRTITKRELERGLFVESKRGLICATCAQKLDEPVEPAATEKARAAEENDPPPAPVAAEDNAQISGMQEQLERIQRLLMFEKSSPWNILAAVTQCLALGLLVAAALRWLEGPQNVLIVALIFQVMALTFFVKGK